MAALEKVDVPIYVYEPGAAPDTDDDADDQTTDDDNRSRDPGGVNAPLFVGLA